MPGIQKDLLNISHFEKKTQSPQDIHYNQIVQQVKSLANINVPDDFTKIKLPPRKPGQSKLLVLDMDETLMHCVDDLDFGSYDVLLELSASDFSE